jgi:hypothetical protein
MFQNIPTLEWCSQGLWSGSRGKKLPILDFAMFKIILTLNQNAQKHFTPILNIQKNSTLMQKWCTKGLWSGIRGKKIANSWFVRPKSQCSKAFHPNPKCS